MKQQISTSLQQLVSDRGLLSVLLLFLFGCVAVIIYLGLNLQPSDLQLVVHYTSFGTTNFYRDKWYYLLSFAVFMIIMAITHTVLTYKILQQKGHDLAVAFAWLGVVIVFIAAVTLYQVLRIAALT